MNNFGIRLRELRETKGLLLRQVAAHLEKDTAFISKIERGERKVKREQVIQLSNFLCCNSDELITLWLADQVYELVKGETNAKNSLQLVINEFDK